MVILINKEDIRSPVFLCVDFMLGMRMRESAYIPGPKTLEKQTRSRSKWLFAILLFLIFIQPVSIQLRSEPGWLKPGFYVEYFVESVRPGIWLVPNSNLYNSSLINGQHSRLLCNGTYRFELITMNTTFARFNISLDLNAWVPSKSKIMPGEKIDWMVFKLLQKSFMCDVDLETLVTYREGKILGIFPLWRGFKASSGEVPLLLNFFGRKFEANYTLIENFIPYETPLGTFKYVFAVHTFIEMLDLPYVATPSGIFILLPNSIYDRDTLLLVCGRVYMDDILFDNGILCFEEMNIRETTLEFPQLEEHGFEFQGGQIFLGLLLAGLTLPLFFKLFKRARIARNLGFIGRILQLYLG